jgi:glutathione S-transferase
MKLYQFSISPNARRTSVLAKEIGIKLEIVDLDFMKGEHKKPEYLAKNPMGKVPTIEDDGGYTLWESCATLVYLATKYPEKNLFPNDARKRAEVTKWMFWNASHLEPGLFEIAFEKMFRPMMGGTPDASRIKWGEEQVARFAPVLNNHLEGKQYLVGEYSIADIALGTTLEFAQTVPIDLGSYKHIGAWLQRLTARDAWKK